LHPGDTVEPGTGTRKSCARGVEDRRIADETDAEKQILGGQHQRLSLGTASAVDPSRQMRLQPHTEDAMAVLGRLRGNIRIPWSILISVSLLSVLLIACGGQQPKVHRVGVLCGLDVFATTVDGFKAKMTELGYLEGQNIAYDVQRTNFDAAAEQRILKKFVADKVDTILVFPSEAAVEAKRATQGTSIPVVFCQTNVEGTNLVESVRAPGGNMTGVRYPGPDLALKRFEILLELVPHAKRVWVPYSTNAPIVPAQLAVLRPAAANAGVTLLELPAATAAEVDADLAARGKAAAIGIDAILFISEPLARTPAVFQRIGSFAAKHRLPIGGVLYSWGGYSTLFGVATNNLAVGALAAQQTDKILRGIPAGTIPVVSAESFFQINYRVARELGLTVTEAMLRMADEVIR
jgi:putative tryptophan/tyrosine transport system substrate-binding protein